MVVGVVNFIVPRALNDCQVQTLLNDVGNKYTGLRLHINVRCLSSGKVLSRLADCLGEIRTFVELNNVEHPDLADTEWLLKFHYLVDMTEHLNQLNVQMQAVGNSVQRHPFNEHLFYFKNKLELFTYDLETCRYYAL
jgi:zinc finger BED domain-containing protein 5/7/8/9